MNRLALVLVRDGVLPAGADETAAEAGGELVIVGTQTNRVDVDELPSARIVRLVECRWEQRSAAAVETARALNADIIIVPASPDGRDLAPRLASRLGRHLFAGAIAVDAAMVRLSRMAGHTVEEHRIDRPCVVTMIPGLRGSSPTGTEPAVEIFGGSVAPEVSPVGTSSVRSTAVLEPDAATVDLAEAKRIVAGGSGLGSTEKFDQLRRVGESLGAALGGTRVASDAGWIPFSRQIGTTGVEVDPHLYLAFAISGATQHVSGLGNPHHIIAVNTDPSCPMMTMANLAIVSDARAVIDELEKKLSANG